MSVLLRHLARHMDRELLRKEAQRALRVTPDGTGLVARCAVCPKRTADFRRYNAAAYRTIWRVRDLAEAEIWFAAHRLTGMHAYYRDNPPLESVEVYANGGFEQRTRPIPFEYAMRTRLGGDDGSHVADRDYFDIEIPQGDPGNTTIEEGTT